MSEIGLSPLFKYFLDQMPDAVFLVDENQQIIFLNHSAEKLTGTLQKDMMGKSCKDIFGKSNDMLYCNYDDFTQADQDRMARRSTIRLPGGSKIPVEMCLVRVPENLAGKRMVIGTIKDLTMMDQIRSQVDGLIQYGNILTRAPSMKRVFDLIDAIADTMVNVLIQGESGTGKELVAQAIHKNSPQKEGPFHAVNCGALTLELLDSEIFGHEKGAFTGAIRQKPGRLELAESGTLFLDEVGDMPAGLQVKLLRVLQERKYERVGGTQTLEMDARIIAATNIDLERAVKNGRFRQDLFFRLNVVPITLPPLRDRPEDIDLIAKYYLAKFAEASGRTARRFAPDTQRILLNHSWVGNVRELINTVEYAVAVSPGELIMPQDLPGRLHDARSESKTAPSDKAHSLFDPSLPDSTEDSHWKRRIQEALSENGYRRDLAAKALDISRTTLWRKMRELEIS